MPAIILKATEKCNANCVYCDVVHKEETGSSMPLDILENVYMRIGEYLTKHPDENIDILWHGGEPLILGVDYYRQALKFQQLHCAKNSNRIEHSMQTNLTKFTEDYVDVFRSLGINGIGTSYDPQPNIRGLGKRINSDLYNKKFIKALNLLDKHDIGWGMIYVVTRRSLDRPEQIFFFLSNFNLTGGFNINPVLVYDDNVKGIAITPDEYVDFLGSVFSVWWEHRHRYPEVEPFKSLYRNIIHHETRLGCVDSGACAYHHINVAPDGETSQCGRSADWGLLKYGNIKDRSLDEILSNNQRGMLNQRTQELFRGECAGCRFWDLCHGGCPLDAYSEHKSFMHKSNWCDARRGFIEKYFEPITGVRFESRA